MTGPQWHPSPLEDAGHRQADDLVAEAAAQRPQLRPDIQTRPGEGPPSEHIATVDWRNIAPEDEEPTLTALAEFLTWAVPRWGFTADQFPYGCWWLHSDVLEEMTAWWTLWQAYIRNPYAHPADPMAFNDRTNTMKTRLGNNYRGRCRKGHEPVASPSVKRPSFGNPRSAVDPTQAPTE
jgi:hypothetical protein